MFLFTGCYSSNKITINTYPDSANVYDLHNNEMLGETPYIIKVSNSSIGKKEGDCKFYESNINLVWSDGKSKKLKEIYVCYGENKQLSFYKK